MTLKETSCTIGTLVRSGQLAVAEGTENDLYERIQNTELSLGDFMASADYIRYVGVTDEFRKVMEVFPVPEKETPAGFRKELIYGEDGCLRVDLVRDIAFEKNGVRRPTNMLFSANTANPFEVESMKYFIANLTTNPAIIYQQFLNNPKANKNNQFKDRYEVLEELGRLVGPGVDISVEFDDPFAPEEKLMEEISRFEEILTPYRLVVKVPHTGPLNTENVKDFLAGNYPAVEDGASKDFFYGHNLAYKLQEKGYKVNFTLMGEPHQTALALLAKPYFINAFVEKRHDQTERIAHIIENLDKTGDTIYREMLHDYMMKSDMLSSNDADLSGAEEKARRIIRYRNYYSQEGHDGLDSVRHSLRVLRQANLPDTRLIVCNTKSDQMYYDIDKLSVEPEFADMKQRIVLTCEPGYFGRFTGSPTIYTYQRSFLNSVSSGGGS